MGISVEVVLSCGKCNKIFPKDILITPIELEQMTMDDLTEIVKKENWGVAEDRIVCPNCVGTVHHHVDGGQFAG